MREFAVYTAARIGLFLATYVVVAGGYLLVSGDDSLPVLWPLLLAAVLSSVASLTLLKRQRQRFADVIDARARAAAAKAEQRGAEQRGAERPGADGGPERPA